MPPAHIPIIHLEISAEEIGRCFPAQVALWGDARAGLAERLPFLNGKRVIWSYLLMQQQLRNVD